MSRCLMGVAVVLVVACAGEDAADDTGRSDAAIDGSPGADAPPGCSAIPAPGAPWIRTYQDDVVAALTGERELEPGQRLAERSTAANRDVTREVLQAELAALGYAPRTHDYGSGANVYAQLDAHVAGAQAIVIGAHFDTVPGSPGANDNATGVAMVLSLARYLRDVECRTKTVVVAMFDEEELGLVGSFHFAEFLATSNLDVVAVHTIDQNGWDANGDRLVELERASPGLFEHYEAVNDFGIPLQPTQTGATDHVRFREAGFLAIGVTEGFASGDTTPHYHRPTDTYATVDFAYLESTTVLAHAAIAAQVRSSARMAGRRTHAPMPVFRRLSPCRGR